MGWKKTAWKLLEHIGAVACTATDQIRQEGGVFTFEGAQNENQFANRPRSWKTVLKDIEKQ